MLSSGSNQYLRPEYLSPLPTTLDAKKSPLALLAQTCSNIGADCPNTKPSVPSLDKLGGNKDNNGIINVGGGIEHKRHSNSGSSTHSSNNNEEKCSFKPYESIKSSSSNNKILVEETIDVERTGFVRSNKSSASSPAISVTSTANSGGGAGNSRNSTPVESSLITSKSGEVTSVTSSLTSPLTSSGITSLSSNNKSDSDLIKETGFSPFGAFKPGNGLLSSLSCTPTSSQFMSSADALAYHSSLLQQQHGVSPKPGGGFHHHSAGSMLSPYVGYARVKSANGGTTLVPVCRDPYCTNCQLSMQSAQILGSGICPSGCTQCNHEKIAAGIGIPGLTGAPLPHHSYMSPALSNLYSPAAVAAAAAMSLPHKPYVCNWISGVESYCGKRFSSSDELLTHLRTHTSLSTSSSGADTLLNPPPMSASAIPVSLACQLHYGAPIPTALHRSYPTSLSPVSSLAAASRFHPYKSPFSAPSLAGGAPLMSVAPPPGLGAFLSPYSYSPARLGAAAH